MAALIDMLPRHAQTQLKLQQMLAAMPVGARLMPERDLSERLGVSRLTLRRAIGELRHDGTLEAQQGRGTFLRRKVESPLPVPQATYLVGLIVPSIQNRWIARIVQGIEDAAASQGYHIVLTQDRKGVEPQMASMRKLVERQVDGLIAYVDAINLRWPAYARLLTSIAEQHIPLVLLNHYVPDVEASCVLTDNIRGGYLAGEHLILAGCRRFALLGIGEDASPTIHRDRRKGLLNAMSDYGLAPRLVREADLGPANHNAGGRRVVAQWLAQEERPSFDAIFCMEDNMAYGAYRALREAGLRVPEDVALVGYDNLDRDLYRAVGLELTSIDQSAEQIGPQAVASLMEQITETPAHGPRHVLLTPKLVVRASSNMNEAAALSAAVHP